MLCRGWPGLDLAALRAGYGPGLPGPARIRLGQLRLLIGYAAHHVREARIGEAEGDLAALRRLLG
jgi:hypothetical protein